MNFTVIRSSIIDEKLKYKRSDRLYSNLKSYSGMDDVSVFIISVSCPMFWCQGISNVILSRFIIRLV